MHRSTSAFAASVCSHPPGLVCDHERILEQLTPSASDRRARSTFEFIDVTNNDLAALSVILEAQNVEWMLVAYPHSSNQQSKAKQMPLKRAAALREGSASDESQVPENSRRPASFAIALHREAVRDFSMRASIPFVNTREDFVRARVAHPAAKMVCEPGSSELEMASCLFVSAMGPHPTGLLYGFIAKSIGRTVLGQLGCVGRCTLAR